MTVSRNGPEESSLTRRKAGRGRGFSPLYEAPELGDVGHPLDADEEGGLAIRNVVRETVGDPDAAGGQILPDTAIGVFEHRAVWKEFPRPFLKTLAEKFNSLELASGFALFCEETGFLEDNLSSISQYSDPELALGIVVTALSSYGNTMGQQGEFMKAKKGLEFGLALDPNYVPLWLGMAEVSLHLSDFRAAEYWADKSINFEPDPNSENAWERTMASEDLLNEIRNQGKAIKDACKQ